MITGAGSPKFHRPSIFDDLPALSWRDETNARVFYCDAFISHRRGDSSEELRIALEKCGVRAWHDGNADLTHQKVRDHVRLALSSSRIIIAFIEESCSPSDWRRAECEPGLRAGSKAGFERVVVVLREQGLDIPPELVGCRVFLLQDTDLLADFLRNANKPPLANEEVVRRWLGAEHVLGPLPFSEVAVLGTHRLHLMAKADSDDPLPWEEWVRDLLATDLGVRVGGGWLDDGVEIPTGAEEPLWTLFNHLGGALLQRKDVLVRLAPYEIVDFVLAPLAWLQSKPKFEKQARLLFAKLCLGVAEHSKYGQHATAWLVLSDFITKKPDLNDARMAMWEALDKVYEMERHLQSVIRFGSYEDGKSAEQLQLERQSDGIQRCRLAVEKLSTL